MTRIEMAKTLFDLGLMELIKTYYDNDVTSLGHNEIQFCGGIDCDSSICPVSGYCELDSHHELYGSLTKDELEELLETYPELRIIL